MPTLAEFDHLFAGLPELPPMQPRKRPVVPEKNKNKTGLTQESQGLATQNASATESLVDHSIFARVRQLFGFSSTPATAVPDQPQRPPWRPNPFAVLKQGKKIIVIAVVDSGSVGFFRFGQGCFEEFPMA
jgi:tRNA-splicing endonuclease subunit Sen54